MESLFNVFAKLDDPKEMNKDGTGLGLYITKTLIQQMGGTITLDSEYGKFTMFSITLPEQIERKHSLGDRSCTQNSIDHKQIEQQQF